MIRRELETCTCLLLDLVQTLHLEREEFKNKIKDQVEEDLEIEIINIKDREGASWWKDVYLLVEAAIGM